jgi:AraC-like DNA-binding protein
MKETAMRFLLHDFGQFHPGHQIGPNAWPHFDLLWLHSGRVTLRIGRSQPVELTGGDGVLIFPHTPFEGKAVTPTAFASVQHFAFVAHEDLPAALRRFAARHNGHRVYRGFAQTAVGRDIERAVALGTEPQTKALGRLRELNLAMILEQLESKPARSGPLPAGREMLAVWRREFRQKPLQPPTVAELARRVGLSPEKLRAFLAARASNPRRFLLEMRMEHARQLLTGGTLPIKAIAAETGYADVVAFHRAFTGYFSETPATHREHRRKHFTG